MNNSDPFLFMSHIETFVSLFRYEMSGVYTYDFHPKITIFSWTLIVRKDLWECCHYRWSPPITKKTFISSVLLDNESLNFQMDDANEAFHIELQRPVFWRLSFEFSGHVQIIWRGFTHHITYNGEKKYFNSVWISFAREAFPSVDEPEAKSYFWFLIEIWCWKANIFCQAVLTKSIAIAWRDWSLDMKQPLGLCLPCLWFWSSSKVRQRKHKTVPG